METISFRRVKFGLAAFCLLMFLLVCRLFYIQIICHDELEEMAISQYAVTIEGINTGQYYYFISKEKCDERLYQLADLLYGEEVSDDDSAYFVFRTEVFDDMVNANLTKHYNAYVFKSQLNHSGQDLGLYFWADAAGRIFVGEEPKKSSNNDKPYLVQDVVSSNITEKT